MHFMYSICVLYKTCLAWWWLISKVKTYCSISSYILSYICINCRYIIINLQHNGMSNWRMRRFQTLMAVTMKFAVTLDQQNIIWGLVRSNLLAPSSLPRACIFFTFLATSHAHHSTNSENSHCRQHSWEVVKMRKKNCIFELFRCFSS